MKKTWLILLTTVFALLACAERETPAPDPGPEPPVVEPEDDLAFVRGADISWASEMAAGGVKFRKKGLERAG